MSLFDLIKTAVMVETMKVMVTTIVKAIVTAMVKGMNEPYCCERELKDSTNVIYNVNPVIPYIYVTLRSIRDQLFVTIQLSLQFLIQHVILTSTH